MLFICYSYVIFMILSLYHRDQTATIPLPFRTLSVLFEHHSQENPLQRYNKIINCTRFLAKKMSKLA